MIVNFTKVGGMAMIQPAGGSAYLISNKPDFCLNAPMSVRVMSDFGYLSYDLTAITDIQVGGVAVLSQADFLVQIATVFPNTNSGSGGSVTLTTTGSSGAATLLAGTLNIPIYAGGGGTTTFTNTTATAGQTVFPFTAVPANASDYMIFKNRVLMFNGIDYTTAANVVTMSTATVAGDIISYQRIK